jgi:hypothetical protein
MPDFETRTTAGSFEPFFPGFYLTLKMACLGDAFSEGQGSEVARVLRLMADNLEGEPLRVSEYRVCDINGNQCGLLRITE